MQPHYVFFSLSHTQRRRDARACTPTCTQNFHEALANHLNAEIILGTVSNMREANAWLSYTYMYTRMLRNPMGYGVTYEEKAVDPLLTGKRHSLVLEAAKTLMACRMVKFDAESGNFFTTDVGRVASHYYIHHESVAQYNAVLKERMTDEEVRCVSCMHARMYVC